MHGAVGRVGEQHTAFANREAKYNLSVLSVWKDSGEDDKNIKWTREFSDAIRSFATGAGYVNYMTENGGAERIRATYDANYERLVAIKRKYDPTNFFSGNQNITPST
jgi:FAD/FMN-containing dehydrogenase